MTREFTTPLADLLASIVRVVRRYGGEYIPPLPPWIKPEESVAKFALKHPQEAERMVNELYTLLQNYMSSRCQ